MRGLYESWDEIFQSLAMDLHYDKADSNFNQLL